MTKGPLRFWVLAEISAVSPVPRGERYETTAQAMGTRH
jgi:hypothetical protein